MAGPVTTEGPPDGNEDGRRSLGLTSAPWVGPGALRVATRLGLTSFGGPIAHLGDSHAEYVERRHWLDAPTYADLVALCQFLPGPASSQVGDSQWASSGRGCGPVWRHCLAFTFPSALALVAFAYGLQALGGTDAGWLHGLREVAVAVVAQAVWGMARTLTPDRSRATIAVFAAIAMLAWPTAIGQVLIFLLRLASCTTA